VDFVGVGALFAIGFAPTSAPIRQKKQDEIQGRRAPGLQSGVRGSSGSQLRSSHARSIGAKDP